MAVIWLHVLWFSLECGSLHKFPCFGNTNVGKLAHVAALLDKDGKPQVLACSRGHGSLQGQHRLHLPAFGEPPYATRPQRPDIVKADMM